MLLKLAALPQVPAAHSVVQAPCPQPSAVIRNVDAAGAVCVALELPAGEEPRHPLLELVLLQRPLPPPRMVLHPPSTNRKGAGATPRSQGTHHAPDHGLVLQVPDHNVAIAAAGKADLGVRADCQGVAGGGGRGQLGLDARGGRCQVPNGQGAGLTAHDQTSAIWQQLAGANIVVPVLGGERSEAVAPGYACRSPASWPFSGLRKSCPKVACKIHLPCLINATSIGLSFILWPTSPASSGL